jgi:hypothetical protein
MNAVVQPKEIDISELLGKRTSITEQVARAQVTNDDEESRANDLLKIIKNMIKSAEEERMSAGKWFRDKLAEINAKYKDEITAPLEVAKTKLEGLIKPYALEKLKKRQEEERLAREKLEQEAIEKARALEKQGKHEDADEVLETAEKAVDRIHQPTTVRSTYGAVTSSRIVYKFEVEDLNKVPREYLVLDESKVRKAINGDNRVTEIPGIKIVEDVQITSR